ncbi:hypothetical protein NVP1247A_30 [Vibrio phage 1.247.A._10N.261.54.E12]|nr:hypothetical protein NVP1247A_30 [Vibrio phage 1.247.A._10N.261.54.E12]AUR98174.1 hypothetical protein NVP1247B_30 [Vibrio phage 1.247.B._10N.261.54.E12]
MESINEYGRSAADIANIIAGMDNHICDSSVIDKRQARRAEVKARMDAVTFGKELEQINNDEYDIHGVRLTKAPDPANPNSIKYARSGGNNGWTASNGYIFAK